jgi:dTDP-D-glucose 4,6-dehydratase
MKRAPQSVQSVPNSHWAAVPDKSKSEPGPPSWHALLFANAHVLLHNIGGGTELTNMEITRMILELCNKDEEFINPVADRLGHDRRYSVDWSKSHKELGYSPLHTLANTLPEIIDWYRKNESWWRPLKK